MDQKKLLTLLNLYMDQNRSTAWLHHDQRSVKYYKLYILNLYTSLSSDTPQGPTSPPLIKDCINTEEPEVTTLFNILYISNNQMEFLEGLITSSTLAPSTYTRPFLWLISEESALAPSSLEAPPDILKGIYEDLMTMNDMSDRIFRRYRALLMRQKVN